MSETASTQTATAAPAEGATQSAAVTVGDQQYSFLDSALPRGWSKSAGVPEALEGKFTSVKALAGSYANLEKAWGNPNKVVIPGPTSTAEEIAGFRKALGVPGKPEEYGFAKPDKLKVGDRELAVPDTLWDKPTIEKFSAFAHAHGLTKPQADALIQFDLERNLSGSAQIEQQTREAFERGQADLKKEWGANYDAKLKVAQGGARALGGDELFNHPLVQNDPVIIKALYKAGAAFGEKPNVGARIAGDNGSPADPRAEARRLQQDLIAKVRADGKFKNSDAFRQQEKRITELYQLANPV